MINWYKIFNEDEFLETGLPSREYEVVLDAGVGLKTILVTRGNLTGMLFEGVFLCVNLNNRNPFTFDANGTDPGYAIYKDQNTDVWLGIEVEE